MVFILFYRAKRENGDAKMKNNFIILLLHEISLCVIGKVGCVIKKYFKYCLGKVGKRSEKLDFVNTELTQPDMNVYMLIILSILSLCGFYVLSVVSLKM